MSKVAYKRVSTADQNTARQLDSMTFDKVFEDKISGKDVNRPALQAMLEYVRDGDELYVHSLDRLGRNTADLIELVNKLKDKGVTIIFEKQGLKFKPDTSNPMNTITTVTIDDDKVHDQLNYFTMLKYIFEFIFLKNNFNQDITIFTKAYRYT